MTEPIRIANCSGFFGDRLSGAEEMVQGGPIDVLTGDWLAELTMLILSRLRAKNPGGGFAGTFVKQMEQVMGTCVDRGIKVVSNAGGLNPQGCAEAVQEIADRLGLSPRVAYVDGDDLAPRLAELIESGALQPFDDGNPHNADLFDPERYLTANAYLGCWGIVDALTRGADIVITGRVTDAAVTCGPAAWHHGWQRTDLDQLAGAVVAGHLIECSAQVTGGNYSFFEEVPGYDHLGFPWAEVAADGSSIVGKHDDTGGLVSVGTVTSQLLYEIGGARYLGPDVTARLDTVKLEQVAPNRVRVSGVRGESPPDTLKVATNRLGGYRNSMKIALTGLDIENKAAAVESAFWAHCPYGPDDYESVTVEVARTDHADPDTNDRATASLTVTARDGDERKVGRAFTNSFIELALASIPGFYALSGPPGPAAPYGVYQPAMIAADLVPGLVHIDGAVHQIDSAYPGEHLAIGSCTQQPPARVEEEAVTATATIELGRLAGARSGDKGGNANLGVFVRNPEHYGWLCDYLSVDRLKTLLPECSDLPVERFEFPNFSALNFVIHGLLDEGVAAATRTDGQAKSLGEWLRARIVDAPAVFIDG